MRKLFKNLYEHLKTKKKYNTLLLKYEVAKEDLEKKQVELSTQKRINLKKQEVWEKKLTEQEEEIIKLKEEIKNIKRKRKADV